MDILERVRSSLSQVSLGNNQNQSNIDVDAVIGADLLHYYEVHQSAIHANNQAINRSAKSAVAQVQQTVDQSLKYNDEWQRFRIELDTMPSINQSINQLSAKVAEVGAKFDRLERALALVVEAREEHLTNQYQSKKDVQLDRQRESNSQSLNQLKIALEAQSRKESAVYQSINQVPPPLINFQSIPNRPAPTQYGSADLGQIPTVQIKRVSRKSINVPISQSVNQASTSSPTALTAAVRKESAPVVDADSAESTQSDDQSIEPSTESDVKSSEQQDD